MTQTAEKAQLIWNDESYAIIGAMFISENLVSFRVFSGPKFS
jgi:hypothetical protein